MVDCASLENWRAERFRGFESHPLRQFSPYFKRVADQSSPIPGHASFPPKCAKMRQNAPFMGFNWLPFGYPLISFFRASVVFRRSLVTGYPWLPRSSRPRAMGFVANLSLCQKTPQNPLSLARARSSGETQYHAFPIATFPVDFPFVQKVRKTHPSLTRAMACRTESNGRDSTQENAAADARSWGKYSGSQNSSVS